MLNCPQTMDQSGVVLSMTLSCKVQETDAIVPFVSMAYLHRQNPCAIGFQ